MFQVKSQLSDFRKFILRGNVVDLAVAVAIGAAFTTIVTTLANEIIKPLIASFGSATLGQGLGFSVRHGNPEIVKATFLNFGSLISATINFLIVAGVIFFLIVQPVNKLTAIANKNKKTEDPSTKKCPECLSEIPKDARRCKFCTAVLVKDADKSAKEPAISPKLTASR